MGVETLVIAAVAGAVVGAAAGGAFSGEQSETSSKTEKIKQQKPAGVSEGQGRIYSAGRRCRVNCHVLFKSDVIVKTTTTTSSGKGGGASSSEVDYTVDIAFSCGSAMVGTDGRGRIALVKQIIMNGFIVYKDIKPNANKHLYDNLEIRYAGASAAPLQVLIDNEKNNPPAYKGQTVIGFTRLLLNKWGGSIPSTIDVILQTNDDPFVVGDALRHLWLFAGLDTNDLTVQASGKNSVPETETEYEGQFEGIWQEAPFNVRTAFDKVLIAYDLIGFHRGREVIVVDRGEEDVFEVDPNDFGTYETFDGRAQEHPYGRDVAAAREKPDVVWIQYHDPERKYQVASVPYRRQIDDEQAEVVTIDLSGMAFFKQSAKRMARTRVRRAYQEREIVKCTLPPDYFPLEEVTVIHFVDPEDPTTRKYVRIGEITEGANFWREINGTTVARRRATDDVLTSLSDIYGPDEQEEDDDEGPDVGDDDDDLTDPYDMVPAFLDLPPMTGAKKEAINPLIRFSHVVDAIPQVPYLGSVVYKSTNGGEKFKPTNLEVPPEGVIGAALTLLPDNRSAADQQTWDYGSFVDVQFIRPAELVQVDEDDVLESENIFLIGGELVGVQKPIQLDSDGFQWRLTWLLRGMFNTEAHAGAHPNAEPVAGEGGTHVIGERVVQVDYQKTATYEKPDNFLYKTLLYKDVGLGNDESDVDAVEFTYQGENMRPFSPACLMGALEIDAVEGTLTAFRWSWYRRSRLRYSIWEEPPLLEPKERYYVWVWDMFASPDPVVVFHNLLPEDTFEFLFSFADQVAAGVTIPGSTQLVLEVRQWSKTVGQGRPAYQRITP